MSKTLAQIFALNPTNTISDTDLLYLVESPYTPGTDSAILGSDLKALFVSSTAIIDGAHGGTGVANTGKSITIGGSVTFSGSFTFTGTLTGNTSVTFPTSGTLATTSQLLVSPLTTKGDIWVWSTTNDRLPVATGDGKVLQVSSGAATGLAYSTPTYPSASGTSGTILRSNGTNNVYSTSTFADTYAINTLLYNASANTVSGLATQINSGLLTNGSGVPAWVTVTGTGSPVLATSPTLVTPILGNATATSLGFPSGNGIVDANGNSEMAFVTTASAVNYLTVTNQSTGNNPSLGVSGSDTNISFILSSKGTGGVIIQGTGTNNNAAAGSVGEFVSSVVATGSAVSLTNNTAANVTSISLTAGDWDVWGNITFIIGGVCTLIVGWTSSTSSTAPDASLTASERINSTGSALTGAGITVPYARYSLSSTTTVYLSAVASFSTSTVTVCGGIYARRAR